MAGVLSVGSSIARMGFFGHSLENLWALTSTEDLSTWTWADATLLASLQDTRGLCAAAAAAAGPPASALSEQVDYLIGCHWDAARDSLWLLAVRGALSTASRSSAWKRTSVANKGYATPLFVGHGNGRCRGVPMCGRGGQRCGGTASGPACGSGSGAAAR